MPKNCLMFVNTALYLCIWPAELYCSKTVSEIRLNESTIIISCRLHNCGLILGDDDHMVKIFDCDSMQCVRVINTCCSVAVLKLQCTHLAVGSFNSSAMLWTLLTSEINGRYVGHTSAVLAVNFSLCLDIFVSGSADKTIILWSLTKRTPLHSIPMNFWPSSIHFVFSSEIPHRSSTFMLAAGGHKDRLCEVWLVNLCNSSIVVSSVNMLWNGNEIIRDSCQQMPAFSVDVTCNKKLILALPCLMSMEECCINFKSSEHTGTSCKASSSVDRDQPALEFCHRDFCWRDCEKLMLLGAGSCFSVYLTQLCDYKDLLIVRHGLSSPSKLVGCWHLLENCR